MVTGHRSDLPAKLVVSSRAARIIREHVKGHAFLYYTKFGPSFVAIPCRRFFPFGSFKASEKSLDRHRGGWDKKVKGIEVREGRGSSFHCLVVCRVVFVVLVAESRGAKKHYHRSLVT